MSLSDQNFDLIMSKLEDIKKDTEKCISSLYGNGKPGLIIEVDRLKVCQDNRSRFHWIIIGVVSALLVGSIYNVVYQTSALADLKREQTNVSSSTQSKQQSTNPL